METVSECAPPVNASMPCPECCGHGIVPEWDTLMDRLELFPCPVCSGAGSMPADVLPAAPLRELLRTLDQHAAAADERAELVQHDTRLWRLARGMGIAYRQAAAWLRGAGVGEDGVALEDKPCKTIRADGL